MSGKKPELTFIFQRVLPHYRLPLFERLNRKLDNSCLLTHGQAQSGDSFAEIDAADDQSIKRLKLKNRWLLGGRALWQNYLAPFKKYELPKAVIAEHSPRNLSLFPLYNFCKKKKIPFLLWGHGGSMRRDVRSSNHPFDCIHRWLIRHADAYICYSDGVKEKLSAVTESGKLFVARNTLDAESLMKIHRKFEKTGIAEIKEELGLPRKHYLCFIGRLMADKKVIELLQAFEILKKRNPDLGVSIIGDGPERANLEQYVADKQLIDVHFWGNIADWEESGKILTAADVMVIPGSVGLSVNHAFCFGLPVVTQKSNAAGPYHGPEADFIVNGVTGYFAENDKMDNLVEKVELIFSNLTDFKKNTIDYCQENLLLDTMVDEIVNALEYAVRIRK